MTEEIEIPFGAFDSETIGWTYTIPEGFTAKIEDGKIIVENEDDSIRNEIIEFLTYGIWKESDINKVKQSMRYTNWIVYLEKQKKQKSIEDVAKEVCKDKESAMKFLKSAGIMDENGELTEQYRSEQKPTEWSDDFEENIRILLHEKLKWTSDDGNMSSAVFIDDKTLKDIISGIWFYVGKEALKYPDKQLNVEQAPAEWSEEDKKMLGKCIDAASGYYSPEDKQAMKDWLNSLRPQPKQEWSEEDEENLELVIDCIYKYYPDVVKKYKLKDWLNSLHPQHHWKPSEEQMESLKWWCDTHKDIAGGNEVLCSLYNDLKKL